MEPQSFAPQENKTKRKKSPVSTLTLKIVLTAVLILVLMIPVTMVKGLIEERSQTASEAISEVQKKWSTPQTINGPILIIPYYKNIQNSDMTISKIKSNYYILPELLNIEGNVETEDLRRGLYDIVVYRTQLTLSGNFSLEKLIKENISPQNLILNQARLVIGITDLRGITEQVSGKFGNQALSFDSGVDDDIISSGVSSPLNVSYEKNDADTHIPFSIQLRLKGSEKIDFTPIGSTTTATLQSNCTTPSFDGAYLPEEREVTEKGFSATWKILDLNRNYPQLFTGESWSESIQESTFGTNLLLPVDQYQKSTRSVKYASMIIILFFVICFFTEILQKKNIHPFQYLLIGLAICLFYTMLVALSEHFNFTLSYAIATCMTIVLLTSYLGGILKAKKTAATIGALLLLLYIYVFVLIQMETFALLVGSIGLFIILAMIMYCSLKINWNSTGEEINNI
ncbi:cell envelope integrity protein CreD [Coprobacter tertius]|uniref:Cell envelope integrity protein CreD n=1 Tax=Coprobacter tertius TaxID=2944915 RepID=A0ABT1ML85_9BACT|nr:cell envelope integrity protein CreD [Coprobacter tertius]MCP9612458.1 cell envelope integrity protein CreD [Coprobacter tertius]